MAPARELTFAFAALALTVGIAALIGKWHPTEDLLSLWWPQGLLLGGLLLLWARPALIAGAAIAAGLYLIVFYFAFGRSPNDNGLDWLLYVFAFPCAAIGAAVARAVDWRKPSSSAFRSVLLSFLLTASGFAGYHALYCAMFCRW